MTNFIFFSPLYADRENEKNGGRWIHGNLLEVGRKGNGFPGGSTVKNPPVMKETEETWVLSMGGEDPLGEGMATHSSILAW